MERFEFMCIEDMMSFCWIYGDEVPEQIGLNYSGWIDCFKKVVDEEYAENLFYRVYAQSNDSYIEYSYYLSDKYGYELKSFKRYDVGRLVYDLEKHSHLINIEIAEDIYAEMKRVGFVNG